jgi:hypothetical protein
MCLFDNHRPPPAVMELMTYGVSLQLCDFAVWRRVVLSLTRSRVGDHHLSTNRRFRFLRRRRTSKQESLVASARRSAAPLAPRQKPPLCATNGTFPRSTHPSMFRLHSWRPLEPRSCDCHESGGSCLRTTTHEVDRAVSNCALGSRKETLLHSTELTM